MAREGLPSHDRESLNHIDGIPNHDGWPLNRGGGQLNHDGGPLNHVVGLTSLMIELPSTATVTPSLVIAPPFIVIGRFNPS